MSNDLNSCNFIGRLGADPESAYLPSGEAAARFRIAVGWKTKDKEGAEWVPIQCYGKLAEIATQYLLKGKQVFVQGRFRTRKWQDKDGSERYTTEIIADRIQMLGSRDDAGGRSGGYDDGYGRQPPAQRQPQQGGYSDGYDDRPTRPAPQGDRKQQEQRHQPPSQTQGAFWDFDDDLPF